MVGAGGDRCFSRGILHEQFPGVSSKAALQIDDIAHSDSAGSVGTESSGVEDRFRCRP